LALTIDEKNNSNWEPDRPRIDQHRHRDGREFEFIRSKTKWIGYHTASSCFVDLVTDTVGVPGSVKPRERILLRVAGRVPVSPLVRDDSPEEEWPCLGKRTVEPRLVRGQMKDRDGKEIPGSEEAFSASEAHLWPPPDAIPEVFDVLCPGGRAGPVTAMSDDRGIAFMVGMPDENGERAIVYTSFDPGWHFQGMEIIDRDMGHQLVSMPRERQDPDDSDKGKNKQPEGLVGSKRGLPDWSSSSAPSSAMKRLKIEGTEAARDIPQRQPMFRKEVALCLSIRQGFYFRSPRTTISDTAGGLGAALNPP
jgi:hypothetical protein